MEAPVDTSLELAVLNANGRCLSTLLSCLGLENQARDSRQGAHQEGEAQRLSRALRNAGQPARAVLLDARTFDHLPLPTLVVFSDGRARLLRACDRRGVLLEDAHGHEEILPVSTLCERAQAAIELAPRLDGKASALSRVLAMVAHERRALVQLSALVVASVALGVIIPRLLSVAMDGALVDGARRMLAAAVAAVALAQLQNTWLAWLRQRIALKTDARMTHALCRDAFERALALPYRTLGSRSLGALVQVQQSSEMAARSASSVFILPALDLLTALAYGAALCVSSLGVALPVMGAVLFCSLLAALLASYSAHGRDAELSTGAREQARLHELLTAISAVKALAAERVSVRRWLEPVLEQRVSSLGRALIDSWLALTIRLLQQLVSVGTFVWAAYACQRGELSVGEFLSLSMLADAFSSASVRVVLALVPAWALRRDLLRIDRELSSEEPVASTASADPIPGADAVVFEDVWFRYDEDSPWLLKGVSFRVARGELYPLSGKSGCGKTTSLRLIAGLLAPTRGTVRVFGRDPALVRGHVAYLPQDVRMFAGSIMHNLQILSGATAMKITESATRTGLSAFIATLPMGFETVVPAGGGTLSGGQRQWIALTAAVASERELLLLDEAWSQLDRLTRARLRESLSFSGRSVISVAHEA
jgi:ABC-type bacteriocin/lantibiotic exporter with double-glycine peptidase domain